MAQSLLYWKILFLKQKNSGFKSILSIGFLLAWISALVAYLTCILLFLFLFLRPRYCNWSCLFLLFRVAGGGLMRFFVSNSLKCFSWEFLVAFKAKSNQHYSWHPVWPYKCLHSSRQRITVSLVLRGVHRLWELSNHIILLTETSVNLFTDLTQFTKGHGIPFLYNMHRTISSLC